MDTYQYDVFLSYSSPDRAWVRDQLLPALEQAGLRACVDYRDFAPGAPMLAEIERGITQSRKTLLIFTPAYLHSEWTELETLILHTDSPANRERRFLVVLKEPCELPMRLAPFIYLDFTAADGYAENWARLLGFLETTSDVPPPPAPHPTSPEPRAAAVPQQSASGSYIAQAMDGSSAQVNVYITDPSPPPHQSRIFSAPPAFARPTTPLIGRDALLADMRARLCARPGARLALTGMPGVGKSRLVTELVYDATLQEYFSGGILVASLGAQPALEPTLRRWCMALGLEYAPTLEPAAQLQHCASAITHRGAPCLWVLDDLWTVEAASLFITASPVLTLLFTSRQQDELNRPIDLSPLVGPEHVLPLAPLDESPSVALLQQTAGLPDDQYQPELTALARLVGGLPLLLTLMGSYLRDHPRDQAFDDLQTAAQRLNLSFQSIDETRRSLQPRRGFLQRFLRSPVAPVKTLNPRIIIELSYAALPHQVQRIFLQLAAFQPDPLSFDAATASMVTETRAEKLGAALHLLVQRNLLTRSGEARFRLHRVLWDWAEGRDYRTVEAARRQLHRWHSDLTQPEQSAAFDAWRAAADNWQQMLHTWYAAVKDPDTLARCVRTILPLLVAQAYWQAVLPGLHDALQTFRRIPSERGLVAEIRYWLGAIYYYLADYPQAERCAEEALDDFQALMSARGQAIVYTLLGVIDTATGNYAAARHSYEQALHLTPETEQQNYATCLNNLGLLLHAMGEPTAARPLYERALAIQEQVLGPTHPATAASLNNLGGPLHAMGEPTAARPLHERALAIREQVLGPTHPDTAASLHNLGWLLHDMGEPTAARPYLERALAIQEQVLGPTHPATAASLHNLGLLLHAMGEPTAPRSYLERALAIKEQVLGPTHPDTATSLNNLGTLLHAMGEPTAPRPYLERALAIREQVLGPTHPDTAASLHNLGTLLHAMGEPTAARSYLERALAIWESHLGTAHPYTQAARYNLANIEAAGKPEEE